MLLEQEMVCRDCGKSDRTVVSLQVDRGGRLVRFRVDCDRCCGNFSHYLEHGPLQRAVKEYLDALAIPLPTDAEAGRAARERRMQ